MIRPYTFLLSAFFLIEGIWGLFSSVVFGGLTTNTTHAVIHVLLGITGLLAWNFGNMRLYGTLVGLLLLVVGIMYFIPGTDNFTQRAFNLNRAGAYCNLAVGMLTLLVSRTGNKVMVTRPYSL